MAHDELAFIDGIRVIDAYSAPHPFDRHVADRQREMYFQRGQVGAPECGRSAVWIYGFAYGADLYFVVSYTRGVPFVHDGQRTWVTER